MNKPVIENEFLVLSNGTRLHIPTLELFIGSNIPVIGSGQSGNGDVNIKSGPGAHIQIAIGSGNTIIHKEPKS